MVAFVIARRVAQTQLRNPSQSRSERPQIVEAVQPGPMTVAELETQRVISDPFPAHHLHTGEILRTVAAIAIAEDIALAEVRRARGSSPEFLESEIGLHAVVPGNRHFLTDELDVDRKVHGWIEIDFIRTRRTA